MFTALGALEHLLRPSDYTDATARAREVLALRRHWHLHALSIDLARHGDQVADDVAGVPVVVRNDGGRLVGFVNVCPHRHSLLVCPGGSRQDALRCMVHGWTFDGDGALCRLPDGPSFVGLDGHAVSLRRIAVERCGALVFVNLDEGAPSFQGSLPDGGADLSARFGTHRVVDRWTTTHAVDWKVIVENTVESYHVPSVHPQTFRAFRPPELHDHQLWEGGTRYTDLKPWGREPAGLVARVLGALFAQGPVNRFVHTHYFPTTMTYTNELVSTVMRVMPATDGTTKVTLASCVNEQLRWRALRPLQSAFARTFSAMGRRIVAEDMRVWPHVQRGLQASPFAGVLGTREERVHAFQRFIVQMRTDSEASMQDPTSATPSDSTLVTVSSSPLRARRRG